MRGPVTTKQPQPHSERDWYPYYAGFPNEFVSTAIHSHFGEAESILDPWNGSGTTTAVATLEGLSATGIDINPAATIIARARLTPTSIRDSLVPIAEEIVVAAGRSGESERAVEPLATWLRNPAVLSLRRLQHAVHEVLTSESSLEISLAHQPEEASSTMGLLPSFYYTALFAATRDLLTPFIATNPTWLKDPPSPRHRINPHFDRTAQLFLGRVAYLADRLLIPYENAAALTHITTGSALDLQSADVYDACLTSPPYATRMDYVRSSLSELALLGLGDRQIEILRQRTTGTPVVKGVSAVKDGWSSECAQRIVDSVQFHGSHGSSSYYGPWIRNYLADLVRTLGCIHRAVKNGGVVGLVVQDSYYKEIHIDLQRVVTETMQAYGRCLRSQADHVVTRSLALLNPAVRRRSARRKSRESFLVFV